MKPGTVELPWGDGRYKFCLPLAQIRQLQDKTKVGPLALLRRVHSGEWLVDDLRETLRLGLIGGGMPDVDALKAMEVSFDPVEKPKSAHAPTVLAILSAFLFEMPPAKKKRTPLTPGTETTVDGSTSRNSGESAPP